MRTAVVALLLQAMRAGLQGTMRIKGLLEMMFDVLSDWIDAFIEDIEEVEGSETGNTTRKGSVSPRDSRGETLGALSSIVITGNLLSEIAEQIFEQIFLLKLCSARR